MHPSDFRPSRAAIGILLGVMSIMLPASMGFGEDLRGHMVVVGRGPERPIVETLARAFEQAHVGTAVEIRWNRNFRTTRMVNAGEADVAVAGRAESGLTATTVAWDGLAVIVNFSNPVKNVSTRQVAGLFSGTIRDWSDVDENASGTVRLVLRPDNQNLTDGFEASLGISGQTPKDAEHIRSDQKVLSRVSGQLDAVAYLSLQPALEAMTYGMSVRSLLIDGVEAGKPTVRSGQYRLKRPVILLTRTQPNPLAQAFIEFCLSSEGQRLLDEMYISVRH